MGPYQVDEGDALGCVAGEKTPAHARAAVGCLGEAAERLDDTGLGLMEKSVIVDAREVQGALPGQWLHARQEICGLALLYELLARATQLRSDAVLHPKQRAELTGQTAFADHLLE